MKEYSQVLKATKQRFNKKAVFGFDIETHNNNKEFTLASIVGYDLDNKLFKKVYYSKEDLIKDLKINTLFHDALIFATNLSFDFFGVFFNSEESKNFKTLFRGTSLLMAKSYIKNNEFTPYSKDKSRNYNKSLTFIDSMNYAQLSVKKMGDIIGISKLESPSFLGKYPLNQLQWDQLKEYNIRDSIVTFEFMKFLIKAFEDLGATFKLTIASTSMSLFKNKYLKQKYYIHKEDILKEIFKSYYGGRTEAFKRGIFTNANYYDFNSLYPSVMYNKVYPDPNTLRTTRLNTNKYIMNYEGVSNIEINIPYTNIPVLPHRAKNGKVIFPCGNLKGWYTHIEIREAIKQGAILTKVYKTHYYMRTCSPFKDYVSTLYNKRLEYKKINSPMQYVTKIFMNSLYGKFGQRFTNKENTIHESLVTKRDLDNATNIIRNKDYFVLRQDTKPSSFCVPIWAVYIASYSRLKLFKVLKDNDPIYCDTDSIITKNTLKYSKKLGDLDLEIKIKEGVVVRPKFYALVDENTQYVKIKGLSRRLSYYEFIGLLSIPDFYENIPFTKSIEYTKFCKFKEALRRDFIPNETIFTQKHFNLEDSKRIWDQVFEYKKFQISKPIILKNEI